MAENKKYHFRQILSTLLKEETNFSSAKQSSKLNSRRGIAKKPKNGLILSLTVPYKEYACVSEEGARMAHFKGFHR